MRRPPRVLNLAVLLALALSFLCAVSSPSGSLGATPASHTGKKPTHAVTQPAEVTFTPAGIGGPGVAVAMPPIGLSLEYPLMAQDLGAGACPPPALVSELLQLGSPPLALAGASQDMTVPAGALSGAADSWETATLYSLPAGFWSQLHCLLTATGDPLTVGLNLKTAQPSWAAQMVAGAQSAATHGLSFSLGNEPDLYYLPNYSSLDKPQANEEAAAVSLYLQLAAGVQQVIAGAPLVGPELARPSHWQHALPRIIEQLHEQTVGVHLYPLTTCATPKAVTVGGLLSKYAANAPRSLAWVVADANAARVPAIISEANSASCGGETGVSDSPASAVWAVRFVLSALKTGFQEVRFHLSGDPYDPFIVRGSEVVSRPLDSALVALNQWLPVGSSLHTVAGVRGLVATAVQGTAGKTLLILDNEGKQAQPVVLRDAHTVRIEALSATGPGLHTVQLSSPHGRIKLLVARNSVLAVSP
jgi:hypothetical protein